jgi:hypothetical protein
VRPVDTSRFQFGVHIDDDPEFDEAYERELLDELTRRARRILDDQRWAPPVRDFLLAFGFAPFIGLYLIRFEFPTAVQGVHRDEMWLIVGDMPTFFFTTDSSPTRADALRTYCDVADEWADAVLTDGDVSECCDMAVEPTEEHAHMLKWRTAYIRRELLPLVEDAPGFHMAPLGGKDYG